MGGGFNGLSSAYKKIFLWSCSSGLGLSSGGYYRPERAGAVRSWVQIPSTPLLNYFFL